MSLTDLSSIKGKVANEGATAQGILTSENWNLLVNAVDEVQGATLVAITPSASPTSSSVNVILSLKTGKDNISQCQVTIPASSEANAGVFTPAQLSSLKTLIQTTQNAANTAQRTANSNAMSISALQNTLNSTTTATNAAVRLVIPVFANNSIVFETQEAFKERELDDANYEILRNVEYGGQNFVAWHHNASAGDIPNIDTIALLIVSSDGTPSLVTEELTDELKNLPQLYERVTTVENNKYTYKLFAIVDSSTSQLWVIDTHGGMYYDIATQEFFRYEYKRPKPGAAIGWVKTTIDYVNLDALFVYDKKIYEYVEGGMVAIGSSLELGETDGTAYEGSKGAALEKRVTKLEGNPVSPIYNVTVEVPLSDGAFYSLYNGEYTNLSALHASFPKATKGMILSFAIAKGQWKTYQYTSESVAWDDWGNVENWQDFGSLAAGSEGYVIIDSLCGPRSTTDGSGNPLPYDLASAVQALADYETKSQIVYRKRGLIISYVIDTDGTKMETKQFQGAVSDFLNIEFWDDFGGGGNKVVTADSPEVNGTDAFSTGGAARFIPASGKFEKNEEANTLNLQFFSTEDEEQNEPLFAIENIPMGGNGGTGPVATINFTIMNQNKVIAVNSEFILELDIDTEDEVDQIVIADKTTGTTLKTVNEPKPSGGLYKVDLSEYFKNASNQKFSITVRSGSLSLTKSLTIRAVDVSVASVQTLGYTADTVVRVGGGQASINVYKFPNNVSIINATVEVYHNGEWKVFQEKTITSTATQSVVVNPRDLFGDGKVALTHSVLPIRVHGVESDSGVVGNYLYTGLFVIDSNATLPLILMNWTCDGEEASVKLLQSVSVNIAIYDPTKAMGSADFYVKNNKTGARTLLRSIETNRSIAQTLTYRVENVDYDGSVSLSILGENGKASTVVPMTFKVDGTLLAISSMENASLNINLRGRSNSDVDKSIKSSYVNTSGQTETFELKVEGSNYSSNGFVKDSYGTSQYGQENDPGIMSLRIAEDVKATLDYPLFANQNVETNGSAFQMTFQVKNVMDSEANLIKCYDGKVGLYINGGSIIFTTVGADPTEAASTDSTSIRVNYTQGEMITLALVFEKASSAPKAGTALVKMYVNGEDVGSCYYNTGRSAAYSEATFEFDGTYADLYVYDIMAWRTFADNYRKVWEEYLLTLSDTSSMISEYEENNGVMATQQITEEPTQLTAASGNKVHVETGNYERPQADALFNSGMPYFVITANKEVINEEGYTYADEKDGGNFPSWLESRTSDKKSTIYVDVYAYFPDRPWQNFVAYKVPITNQGTTSSKRPIKNVKMKFKKAKSMELLHKRTDFTDPKQQALFDICEANIKKRKVQIYDTSIPTNIITVKVDYSESGGAHNGASTELFNLVQRALGENYMTPAQIAYDSTKPAYTMNSSIDSIPCAFFRTDTTDPKNAYFHAKGNWNQDKGDAEIYGFENCPGYNKGCLNYGDFIEVVITTVDDGVNKADLLTQRAAAYVLENFSKMDASMPYIFTEFCGPNFKVYRDNGEGSFEEVDPVSNYIETSETPEQMKGHLEDFDLSSTYRLDTTPAADGDHTYKFYHYVSKGFKDTTGRMYFNPTTQQWTITGDVLNPVENYEVLTYDDMAWFRGVSKPEDMIKKDNHWTNYFESRYPDDDDLNALYANGGEFVECSSSSSAENSDYYWNAADESSKLINSDEGIANHKEGVVYKTKDGVYCKYKSSCKKVPYQLFRWLEFCHRADYETGDLNLWRTDLYKYANPYSVSCYHCFTDVVLAVDQRSKNMMVGFYLEKDDNVRMYLNHLYDGDTIWTSDNNCGLTVPVDLDPDSEEARNYYAGYGSVLFRDNYLCGGRFVVDAAGNTITLSQVYNAMRSVQVNGNAPFSEAGCTALWITKRLSKWPKLVSSFDQERKYVNTMAYDDTYLYAMHGRGTHMLPQVFKRRFQLRDAYYGGPSFVADQYGFRGTPNSSAGMKFTFTAAEAGYFTLGIDGTDESRRMTAVHLNAGEKYTFFTSQKTVGNSYQTYFIGCSNVSELDVSGNTFETMNFTAFSKLRKLTIGGASYKAASGVIPQTRLDLGNMPYLEELDIRNHPITAVDTSYCPRLTKVLAEGSGLQTITLAETSRVNTLTAPSTLTALEFVSIPNLTYTGLKATEGFQVASFKDITRVRIENTPKFNLAQLIADVLATRASTWYLRVANQKLGGDGQELIGITQADVRGLDASGNVQAKPVISGTYSLTEILEESEKTAIEKGIDELVVFTSILAYIHNITWYLGGEYSNDEGETPTEDNINEWYMYYNGETYDEYAARELGASGSDGYNDTDISVFIDMTVEEILKYGQWSLIPLQENNQ